MSLVRNVNIAFQDTLSLDSFGRQRVATPQNRADTEFIYVKNPNEIDVVGVGGATATHDTNSRDVTLAIVNTTNTTTMALYNHYDIPYTAGNSQLIEMTGTLDYAGLGSGLGQIVFRTKISGSVVEDIYDQADWEVKGVSSAPAMVGFDWAKSHIFGFDFQSLKVGRQRVFIVKNGIPEMILDKYNDNIISTGYWQSPTLPYYWRIYNDATYTYMENGYGDTENGLAIRYRITKNASATMKAICATVKSEGGLGIFDMAGMRRSVDNGTTPITGISTTLVPILSISPHSTFSSLPNRGLYIPDSYQITSDNAIRYAIILKGTLTGASFTQVNATHSGMAYDVSATAITGGIRVDSGYLTSTGGATRNAKEGLLGKTILALGRTGTSDILTICAQKTGATNASCGGMFGWREIR
jgi:hypothetical protein